MAADSPPWMSASGNRSMSPTEIMKPAANASMPSSARTLHPRRDVTATAPTRLAAAARMAKMSLPWLTRRAGERARESPRASRALQPEALGGVGERAHEVRRGGIGLLVDLPALRLHLMALLHSSAFQAIQPLVGARI